MSKNTCCFLGHRNVKDVKKLSSELKAKIIDLIINNNVDTFLFGSKSNFIDLCFEIVSDLRATYPFVKRIYVRAEYPFINEDYKKYLLKKYEYTYFPDDIIKSGKAVYIKRNQEMINKSQYCIFYFYKSYNSFSKKSGTEIALDYAKRKKKNILFISNTSDNEKNGAM